MAPREETPCCAQPTRSNCKKSQPAVTTVVGGEGRERKTKDTHYSMRAALVGKDCRVVLDGSVEHVLSRYTPHVTSDFLVSRRQAAIRCDRNNDWQLEHCATMNPTGWRESEGAEWELLTTAGATRGLKSGNQIFLAHCRSLANLFTFELIADQEAQTTPKKRTQTLPTTDEGTKVARRRVQAGADVGKESVSAEVAEAQVGSNAEGPTPAPTVAAAALDSAPPPPPPRYCRCNLRMQCRRSEHGTFYGCGHPVPRCNDVAPMRRANDTRSDREEAREEAGSVKGIVVTSTSASVMDEDASSGCHPNFDIDCLQRLSRHGIPHPRNRHTQRYVQFERGISPDVICSLDSLRVLGGELHGRCRSTASGNGSPSYYDLKLVFRGSKLIYRSCNCPNFTRELYQHAVPASSCAPERPVLCKHLVALGKVWLDNPHYFDSVVR